MIAALPLYKKDQLPRESFLNRTYLVIPTWNAGRHWRAMEDALRQQGIAPDQVLIVDSSSTDDTRILARGAGYRIKVIPHESFDHATTRQLAADLLPRAEILVYLTQDAVLGNDKSLERLVAAFGDAAVGACYGRQLSRAEAGPIERHARLFNYPDVSALRTFKDRYELGIRAAFFSNSFAAYRRTAFEQVGGFSAGTIVSEDVSAAARILMAGWKVAYQAEATVIHSHNLTLRQEFSRYFDIGVHHGRERWIMGEFGHVGGEGQRFIVSEARFLLKSNPLLLPWAVVRSASKWCGYHLGKGERKLPLGMKEVLSAQKQFWREERRRRNTLSDSAASAAPSTTEVR